MRRRVMCTARATIPSASACAATGSARATRDRTASSPVMRRPVMSPAITTRRAAASVPTGTVRAEQDPRARSIARPGRVTSRARAIIRGATARVPTARARAGPAAPARSSVSTPTAPRRVTPARRAPSPVRVGRPVRRAARSRRARPESRACAPTGRPSRVARLAPAEGPSRSPTARQRMREIDSGCARSDRAARALTGAHERTRP